MLAVNSHNATTSVEPWRPFFLGVLTVLKLRIESVEPDVYVVRVPAELRPRLAGFDGARFTFSPVVAERHDVECVTSASPLFRRVLEQSLQHGSVVHAAPARQPTNVHELAPILFGAYTIDGGHAHLGGCLLEDVPLLRVTTADSTTDADSAPDCVRHFFVTSAGDPVDESLRHELQLGELVPVTRLTHRPTDTELERWRAIAEHVAGDHSTDAETPEHSWSLLTVVWCKFTTGKLVFTIGESTAEVPFDGWAQQFASGTRQPPPFICPATGKTSYHLAATDDGRITVAEVIARCTESGRRVLTSELVTCAATGKQALPEFLDQCPITETRVLRSVLAVCPMCRQAVSPVALPDTRCSACRSLQPVRKEDPRLARLLDEYPKLDRWPTWQIAETSQTYILTGSGWINRLLLVLRKESLEPLHLATAVRLLNRWSELERTQWDEQLR